MKLSYRDRANSAGRLKKILHKDKPNYIKQNLMTLMDANLPDEEKDFLSDMIEDKDMDLCDQISEYEEEYNRGELDAEDG